MSGHADTDRLLAEIDTLLPAGQIGHDPQFPDGMRWSPPPEDTEAPFDPAKPLDRLTLGFETDEITDPRHTTPPAGTEDEAILAALRQGVDDADGSTGTTIVTMALARTASLMATLHGYRAAAQFLRETAVCGERMTRAIGDPDGQGQFRPNMTELMAGLRESQLIGGRIAMEAIEQRVAVQAELFIRWREQRHATLQETVQRMMQAEPPPAWVIEAVHTYPEPPTRTELLQARRNRNTGPSNPRGIDGRARRHHHPTRTATGRAIPRNPEPATHGSATPIVHGTHWTDVGWFGRPPSLIVDVVYPDVPLLPVRHSGHWLFGSALAVHPPGRQNP